MCGLVALLGPVAGGAAQRLGAMSADLLHRGPDSSGQDVGENWALGFRRLSILAPGAGADQPMRDAEAGLSLVFNGEIYNFRALRSELEARGAQFRTAGDTEVVLRGYQAWGAGVLDRLEGMFALVLVDARRGTALVARDPLGIKPLYVQHRDGLVAVASEVRPLRHLAPLAVDEAALGELLTFGWAAGELSNYAGIRRLRGGTSLTVDLTSASVKEHRYCDPLLTLEPRDVTEAQAEQALNESINAHMVSDVGYSLQLSGGVDSSYIAARVAGAAQHAVRSYAVHIPDYDQDEQAYRGMVLERYALEHEEVEMDGRAFADALPRAVTHMEGPVPHGGCVMLMLLCERIRTEHKVVLTGEGADEMFGGYRRYADWRRLRWYEWFSRLPFAGRLPDRPPFMGVRRIAGLDMPSYASVYHDWRAMQALFPALLPSVGGDRRRVSAQFSDFRDRLLAVDQSAYLESLLVRQDKMSMAA
jgi:asparagine synthase (glutamine-hydrolysing)